jgi:TolA-binding protein
MSEFEYDGAEYAVGDDDAADEAAFERVKSLIEDIGYEGFSEGFVESHIDGQKVADYMEDWYYDDMNDRPEDYLNEDDREMTNEAEEKLDDIDGDIGELQEELENVESESEEQEIVDQIDELENRKEEITEDNDNWEYTEEAKDTYVEGRKDEVKNDPMNALRDFGMEDRIGDFIDEDGFVDDVISSDGRGNSLSSYDGDENEIVYKDEWYYIYRTN